MLGETASVLDITDDMEPLGVRVPVFETDVDPETEFVDDVLGVKLGDALLVEEAQLETDAEAVEDCVEQADIVSDLLCEDDPLYEFVPLAVVEGCAEVDGAELTVAREPVADMDGV